MILHRTKEFISIRIVDDPDNHCATKSNGNRDDTGWSTMDKVGRSIDGIDDPEPFCSIHGLYCCFRCFTARSNVFFAEHAMARVFGLDLRGNDFLALFVHNRHEIVLVTLGHNSSRSEIQSHVLSS